MTEDMEEKVRKAMYPLEDDPRVIEARKMLTEACRIATKARELLKTVETPIAVDEMVEYHKKSYRVVTVKVAEDGDIVLTLRRVKKDGVDYRHQKANSENASDIKISYHQLAGWRKRMERQND